MEGQESEPTKDLTICDRNTKSTPHDDEETSHDTTDIKPTMTNDDETTDVTHALKVEDNSFEIITPQEIIESLPVEEDTDQDKDHEFKLSSDVVKKENDETIRVDELADKLKEQEREIFAKEIRRIKSHVSRDDDGDGEDEVNVDEIVEELVSLKSEFIDWTEIRALTIEKLREIADYVETVSRRTGITKIGASGGGVLAGGLTLLGKQLDSLRHVSFHTLILDLSRLFSKKLGCI